MLTFSSIMRTKQHITYISRSLKKNSVLLSTLHYDKKKNKPEIINFCNETKSGVNTLNQLIRTYTCKRRTNRCPYPLFYYLLDISAYNAYVVFLKILLLNDFSINSEHLQQWYLVFVY